ncbi:MAG: ATP-binding protein [Patescibacteria group bacterium]|nr:ATP-binding protein [Patescibacteria group bacterium]
MKPISTSIFTFADLIAGGYVYVDKTARLYDLVRPHKGGYFLSRPRRFGKSLTVSSLAAIFEGRRELFQGLAIDATDYDWKSYPVIRIDLGDKQARSAEELTTALAYVIQQNAERHSIALRQTACNLMFNELVTALARKERVVILVDEYDKPILGNVENPAVGEILGVLKSFYSVVKTCDEQVRFALLTGVSKFSRVSVFSDLNNLVDLTMDARYADMLGYTQDELERNFAPHIEHVAAQRGSTTGEVLKLMREWYNGYRFSKSETRVYNPVSVGRFLDTGELSNYWFETGTPSFLINLLKSGRLGIPEISREPLDELAFSAYEVDRVSALPLLFQTGYLTIREVVPTARQALYRLDYPNLEVREAFSQYLVESYTNVEKSIVPAYLRRLRAALEEGDLDRAMQTLRIFFADIPFDIQLSNERYYQTIFFVLLRLLAVDADCEVRTEIGRIDAVVKTGSRIYLFEFKLRGTAEEALAQARDRRYAEKYSADGREVLLVGAAFDPRTRNLDRWLVERA